MDFLFFCLINAAFQFVVRVNFSQCENMLRLILDSMIFCRYFVTLTLMRFNILKVQNR